MSLENVRLFYQKLAQEPHLRDRAMKLQQQYADPEKILEAFLSLAHENGLPFSPQEWMQYVYENGSPEK